MPVMGDRPAPQQPTSRSFSINKPQTVVDTKPQVPDVPAVPAPTEVKDEKVDSEPASEVVPEPVENNDLRAMFLRDQVRDGTIMGPNVRFEQSWVLRNEGKSTWPAGCSVRFVGGDYMGHVDSSRPARTAELVEASESNICHAPVYPGEEVCFTVKLRTPPRPGRFVSYWRTTTSDGVKFGDRLWCDVNVRKIELPFATIRASPELKKDQEQQEDQKEQEDQKKQQEQQEQEPEMKSSQMIFPKLETESPVASVHEETKSGPSKPEEKPVAGDDFEDCGKDDEWDGSDDDFLTDEEYDILDASDEEFLEEQQRKLTK